MTRLLLGNYTISASATPVPSEIDKADNTFVDGTVLILPAGTSGRMPYIE
jgi:hypothetical protein